MRESGGPECQRPKPGKVLIENNYIDWTRRRALSWTAPDFDQCRAARSAL